MRTVYEADTIIDAHLVKHALEAEGIPAYVRGESLTGGIGELGVFGLVAVMVPEDAWRQARDCVESLQLGLASGLRSGRDDGLPGALPA